MRVLNPLKHVLCCNFEKTVNFQYLHGHFIIINNYLHDINYYKTIEHILPILSCIELN